MTRRRQRLLLVMLVIGGMSTAVALALVAFRENLLFFYTPSQVHAGEAPAGATFRLGGLVTEGSVKRDTEGLSVRFVLTDIAASVPVVYYGILPDLFREGQGIIAQGKIGTTGVFEASEVLAKHDEKYMPPEVAEALATANKTSAQP